MATDGVSGQQVETDRGNPRVIMWCIPRSVSTAVAKCMSFVEGAEVWLEPYVISKIAGDIYKLHHPDSESGLPLELEGNETVYREASKKLLFGGNLDDYNLNLLSPVALKRKFDSLDPATKFVFIKDMAIGMPPSRYQYLPDKSSGFKHFFLIRHPVKVYKSYRKGMLDSLLGIDPSDLPKGFPLVTDPVKFHLINDLPAPTDGATPYIFKAIHIMWSHIRKTVDENPIILDIDDLLDNPAAMLPRLFNALGIPYSDDLLTWEGSADVVLKWKSVCPNVRDAPRYAMWFTNAFKSTCFKASPTKASLEDATEDIKEVAEKEMPYYEEMHKLRLML